MLNNAAGTNTVEEAAMPNLVGMDFEEAKLQFKDRLDIREESREFNTSQPNGKIFEQDIKPDNPVKKGDTVLLPKYGGTEVKIDGTKYQLVREEDLLGVIEK